MALVATQPQSGAAGRRRERSLWAAVVQSVDERLAVATIVAVAAIVALVWVFRVPMLEQPDETAHVDYVFALMNEGHLLHLQAERPGYDVTPQLRWLEDATALRTVRYNPFGTVPAGYATPGFWKRVDRLAPAFGPAAATSHTSPYVAFHYPFLYYALCAAIGRGAGKLSHDSLVTEYFAIRSFGVVLLVISLVCLYATMRLRMPVAPSLLLLLAIGLLPMTSWVSSYVQPDTLSFAAVAAGMYLALRWQGAPFALWVSVLLGADLAVLALTKEHYAMCLAAPFAIYFAARCRRSKPLRSMLLSATLIFVPTVAALAVAFASTSGGTSVSPLPASFAWAAAQNSDLTGLQRISHALALAILAARDVYFDGSAFNGFWGAFSWVDFPVLFANETGTMVVRLIVGLATLETIVMVVIAQCVVVPRLICIAKRRSTATAAMLATTDVGSLAYIAFTAFAVAMFVESNGVFGLQGRYWLPFVLPTFLFALLRTRRALPRSTWTRITLGGAGALAVYSCVAAPLAIASVERRFYISPVERPNATWLATFRMPQTPPRPRRGDSFLVSGYALDYRTGLPARAVDLLLDGRDVGPAVYHQRRPDIVDTLHDAATGRSGFSATVSTATLRPGAHRLSLKLLPLSGTATPLLSRAHVDFVVVPR